MPKFFADPASLHGDTLTLTGTSAEHLRVLRVREGEELTVNVGAEDCRCAVAFSGGGACQLRVLSRCPAEGEASVAVTVYAALPKGDKTETIIQKSVELGADRICFFLSSRCVARPDGKSLKGKVERWNKIAEAAAMQSFRGKIPTVVWLPDFRHMLADADRQELRAFFWENASGLSLRGLLSAAGAFRTAALVTGPEGGFSEEEAALAEESGLAPVTLGKRILRCETAPLCALSALMFHTGDLG